MRDGARISTDGRTGRKKWGPRWEIGTKTGQAGRDGDRQIIGRGAGDDGSGAKMEKGATGAQPEGGREEGKQPRERRRR